MTRGTIRSSERQTIALRQPSKQHDQKLSRLQMDYFNLLAERSQQACRQSTLYQSSRLRLASIWWPRDLQQRIPASVAHFLLSTAPKVWNDTCALPPLPGGIAPLFIPTFARWVAALSTGLELVSFPASSTLPSGILLCSTFRNVRGTKCCVVVRISLMKTLLSRPSSTAVMSEGWILSLPRRAASSQKRKEDTNVRSSALTTKDSVGMDVLATEIHVSCVASKGLLIEESACPDHLPNAVLAWTRKAPLRLHWFHDRKSDSITGHTYQFRGSRANASRTHDTISVRTTKEVRAF